jgi:hypothetical protein
MADQPHLVTKAAVGDDTKGVAEKLVKSVSTVQQMTEKPEKDRYSRFLQLYYATSDAGAEIFFADFKRRHMERMGRTIERHEDEAETLEKVFRQEAKFNTAAHNGDDRQIVREGSKLTHSVGDMMAISRKRLGQEEGGRLHRMEERAS